MTLPKIAILHNIISPYKTELFNALHGLRNDFEVVYISENEQDRGWKISRDDLKFSHQVMFQRPANYVSSVPLFSRTWQCLNRLNPEVVVIDGYSYASCWSGLLWAKLNDKKLVFWSSSAFGDHKRNFAGESVKKIFVTSCDAYNVYGTKARDYLIRLGAASERITMVGNNTDNSFYQSQVSRLKAERRSLASRLKAAPHNFLFIGRFSPEKNIFTLLKAYRAFKSKGSREWGLILAGDGPLKEEIADFIKTNNLSDISMPGFVNRNDIPAFFAVSDILILPSLSETWGLVVNEAMAAGLPVLVSANCGCSPDLVKEGENGFTFDPHNAAQLADLMQAAADGKYDLAVMGRSSLELISKYTPQHAAELVSATIEQVRP